MNTRQVIHEASVRAFTRAELLVMLAVLALLALVIMPALANSRPRSARVICANNLRQIGMGFQLWGNDFNDQPPWEVPSQLPGASSGSGPGTMLHPLGANAWLHYAWISNELKSARVLLCPSDSGRVAEDFSSSPKGGYLHPNYRNFATSYFLTHAFYGGQSSMFAGDRNLGWDGAGGCSRFPQVYNVETLRPTFGWNTNLHNQAGNIVRLDGRVNQYSNEDLRAAVTADPISDRGTSSQLHILAPR